jgi:Zn-dependent peptidase ImmA (M78 family)/transcriptional regulator with XRE-family HTH domain
MKPGTPKFVGARLREAREARGLNALALSQLIGVSRQAVSQYENGPETPSPAVMRRIAEVLRLPAHFFLRPVEVMTEGPLFYRSMASATKASRTRAESRFKWTREFVRYLRVFVNLPGVNYPQLDLPRDPIQISQPHVEEAAVATRRHWRLGDGPISNVVLLLENNGTIIVRHDLAADTLDAFSMWSSEEKAPYIVLNSEKGGAARSRLNVAHELAHMILHRNVPAEFLARPEMFDLIERQAHSFARAFLLPEKTFGADAFAPTLDAFRALKPKWKVSIQAMIFRAKDLGLLTPEQERRIWPNLSRRGWRTFEPLDDTLEPEEPRLLRRSVELLVSSGAAAPQDLVFHNALHAEDIEELIGLPKGYLGAAGGGPGSGEPTIIRFPTTG